VLREWYGGPQFYTVAGPEPDDPTLVWMDSQGGWLMHVRVDYAKRTWAPRACYRWAERLDPLLFPTGKMTVRFFPFHADLAGGVRPRPDLWFQNGGLILRVARGYTVADEDRQDLAQEILIQMWCSLPRFEGRAKESTWIYRVALNTALAWRRADSRRCRRFTPLLEVEDIPADETERRTRLDNEEALARLYAAIRALPKVDAALVMLHLDGLSYKEMAEVLGITEDYVGVKLNRIRKQLAGQLKGVINEL
jgi:RNA polymerase sigma-70 factor (ECF subfamily)